MTLRERLGAELFRKVAGPNGDQARERVHGTPGPRWFAPDSPIARVHGDASMFVGGIRAVMLQSLHPAAMQGVADHSGYRGDMWGRLARTSQFLAVTTFGPATQAERAVTAVRRVHATVTGTMPDGTSYAASDPHLLAWVHAAEVDSFLLAHQTYGARPLDEAGCDAYVAQAALVAGKLGVVQPPTTVAELRTVLDDFRPELRATEEARGAVRFLILHPDLPVAARPAYAALMAAGIALMPVWTRRPLRLPWLPVSERTVVKALGTLATGTIRWAMSSGVDEAHELRASVTAPAPA